MHIYFSKKRRTHTQTVEKIYVVRSTQHTKFNTRRVASSILQILRTFVYFFIRIFFLLLLKTTSPRVLSAFCSLYCTYASPLI